MFRMGASAREGDRPESSSTQARHGLSRRTFAGGAAAASALSLIGGWQLPAAAHGGRKVSGPGSVAEAPRLPAGFTKTFKSQFVQANGIHQHVVIGGDGPPLLLVHGWPQNWYAWRHLMPALAKDFTVIAVDQRGIGLTDKPQSGYDTATLARDLAALMDALGHQRFAVAGHDTGLIISYALAADYPDRVARMALLEVPGPPTTLRSPRLFVPGWQNDKLWHIPFNRAGKVAEQLITGREDIFFGYEFAIQGGTLPQDVIDYYVRLVSNPTSLSGSLGLYRAWDATVDQNNKRSEVKLAMPVQAIGGALSYGTHVGEEMAGLATNVQTVVIPGAGHWLAEQAPQALLAELTAFLAPYRNATAG